MHYDVDYDTVITGTIKVFIIYLIRKRFWDKIICKLGFKKNKLVNINLVWNKEIIAGLKRSLKEVRVY